MCIYCTLCVYIHVHVLLVLFEDCFLFQQQWTMTCRASRVERLKVLPIKGLERLLMIAKTLNKQNTLFHLLCPLLSRHHCFLLLLRSLPPSHLPPWFLSLLRHPSQSPLPLNQLRNFPMEVDRTCLCRKVHQNHNHLAPQGEEAPSLREVP